MGLLDIFKKKKEEPQSIKEEVKEEKKKEEKKPEKLDFKSWKKKVMIFLSKGPSKRYGKRHSKDIGTDLGGSRVMLKKKKHRRLKNKIARESRRRNRSH